MSWCRGLWVLALAGCSSARVMIGDSIEPPADYAAFEMVELASNGTCREVTRYLWVREDAIQSFSPSPECLIDENGDPLYLPVLIATEPWRDLGWRPCEGSEGDVLGRAPDCP